MKKKLTNCAVLLRFTRSDIRTAIAVLITFCATNGAASTLEGILRSAALENGLRQPEETYAVVAPELAGAGGILFDSKNLSLNGNISCRDCHLNEASSGDALPNAVGVGGQGVGLERAVSGGAIIPRNTLPLWGRGGIGFDVLFWDGKVDFSLGQNISQYGEKGPSSDPLITAVHLPPLEIREMLIEDKLVSENKKEDFESAKNIHEAIMVRLQADETEVISKLATFFAVEAKELSFTHVATAIAAFIRSEFRLQETRFHKFIFGGDSSLSPNEVRGGLIFYGKGKCATCHSGPYLTDFKFHAIAFPQLGFGKNGFGIDYGRFNVTHDPNNLYEFRTPPLYNVRHTAPYGHSGSIASLREAIRCHYDPLALINTEAMSLLDRHEYYKRLALSAGTILQMGLLDDREVDALLAFLDTLSY